MACDECRELNSHEFRSPDDLIHALRTAAFEADRGALEKVATVERELDGPEGEAVRSAIEAGALPGAILYKFRCAVCGDRFTLEGDAREGTGRWIRENSTGPT